MCLRGFTAWAYKCGYRRLYHVKVSTIKGYLRDINRYYKDTLEAPRPPYDGTDKTAEANILLTKQAEFDKEPQRRARLPDKVIDKLSELSNEGSCHGARRVIWLWTAEGRLGGFRQQEYAQDTKTTKKYYTPPNGARILRAFIVKDFIFYNTDGMMIMLPTTRAERKKVRALGTHFKVQKNRRNGQIIKHGRNAQFPKYCAVEIGMELVDNARALGQTDDDPLGVFQDEDGSTKYVTGDMVTDWLRFVARLVFPAISDAELSLILTHSIRVTAAVLLHEAGKDGTYIKLRLRWDSEAYNVYLRNSDIIVEQHTEALNSLESSRLQRIEELASNFTHLLEIREGNDVTPDEDLTIPESVFADDED